VYFLKTLRKNPAQKRGEEENVKSIETNKMRRSPSHEESPGKVGASGACGSRKRGPKTRGDSDCRGSMDGKSEIAVQFRHPPREARGGGGLKEQDLRFLRERPGKYSKAHPSEWES